MPLDLENVKGMLNRLVSTGRRNNLHALSSNLMDDLARNAAGNPGYRELMRQVGDWEVWKTKSGGTKDDDWEIPSGKEKAASLAFALYSFCASADRWMPTDLYLGMNYDLAILNFQTDFGQHLADAIAIIIENEHLAVRLRTQPAHDHSLNIEYDDLPILVMHALGHIAHHRPEHDAQFTDVFGMVLQLAEGDGLLKRREGYPPSLHGADHQRIEDILRNQLYKADLLIPGCGKPNWSAKDFPHYRVTKKLLDFYEGRQPLVPIGITPMPASPHTKKSDRIFVVHGHDEALLSQVCRMLEKLHLTPIVLREQADQGRTVIEKFEDHSAEATYAIILMTSDDVGKKKDAKKAIPRARQNVILELGFFIGRLTRSRIFTLFEKGVETPSDIAGVIYTPVDSAGAWQMSLCRELKKAGFTVDVNLLH